MGKNGRNIIFYDLHSTTLSPKEKGRTRIAAIVKYFNPDLILISVDPHPDTGQPIKPSVVEWIVTEGDCFQEIYRDETVSGFRVLSGCKALIDHIVPENYIPKMGTKPE